MPLLELIVTPVPAAKVTKPVPNWRKSIDVEMAKATLELGGTVTVIAEELVSVTHSNASDRASVYVVPDCASILVGV
jgi:hypothetical protein